MARITVEDCIEHVPNRFELVLLAAKRAREIASGARLSISRENDKNPILALREIGEGLVSISELKERIVKDYQHVDLSDDIQEETEALTVESNRLDDEEEPPSKKKDLYFSFEDDGE
jgi:DNA-directed RNA polymerase subunit omega